MSTCYDDPQHGDQQRKGETMDTPTQAAADAYERAANRYREELEQPGQTCEDRKFATDRVILEWTCPDCGDSVEQPLSEIAECGTATCVTCEVDMVLDSVVTVIPGEEADRKLQETSNERRDKDDQRRSAAHG